jgi:hypothetical protein
MSALLAGETPVLPEMAEDACQQMHPILSFYYCLERNDISVRVFSKGPLNPAQFEPWPRPEPWRPYQCAAAIANRV